MKLLAFLLAVLSAITSAGTLLLGFMLTFADNPESPVLTWGYALIFVAFLMVLLGVLAAILVWFRPMAAEKALWLLVLDGLIAMVLVTVAMSVAQTPEGPTLGIVAGNLLIGGLMPAVAALAALLMLRRHLQTLPTNEVG
jgi:hypothetical protein